MFRRSLALTRFARIGATALGLGVAFLFGRASAVDPALRPTGASIDDILKKNPPAEGEAFRVLPVASGRDSSVSVVRARKALRPHSQGMSLIIKTRGRIRRCKKLAQIKHRH